LGARRRQSEFGAAVRERLRQQESGQIEWADYARVLPGEYLAHCGYAAHYRDLPYGRWVALLRFTLFATNGVDVIARVPIWLSLGEGKKPRAARRGRFFQEWMRANGGPPRRGDRLPLRVFTGRVARVEVGDTNSVPPYTVVRKIITWETGPPCQSVNKSEVKGGR